jgi:hypothetical protein
VCDSQNECETPQAVGSDCNSTGAKTPAKPIL